LLLADDRRTVEPAAHARLSFTCDHVIESWFESALVASAGFAGGLRLFRSPNMLTAATGTHEPYRPPGDRSGSRPSHTRTGIALALLLTLTMCIDKALALRFDPCTGACCSESCACTAGTTADDCSAPSMFFCGGVCSPSPCLGKCSNIITGICTATTASACSGLTMSWDCKVCATPGPIGVCCDNTTRVCTIQVGLPCALGTTFRDSQTACSPNPCPPMGACCSGTQCAVVTPASCTGAYQGDASACGPVGNPTTCCPANFDGVNGLGTPDIFAYIDAWFAMDSRTDFDGDHVISMQDVFAFLNTWLAGC
jgi:hypothetical protein